MYCLAIRHYACSGNLDDVSKMATVPMIPESRGFWL